MRFDSMRWLVLACRDDCDTLTSSSGTGHANREKLQFRITMAAVDPTQEPEADGEGNVPAVPRSTLRLVKRAFPGLDDEDDDDEVDDEYLRALLAGDDDESDSDEEANGGPSDPAKSKKQKQAEAIKKLIESAQAESDEDEEMEDAKPKSKGKGKGKAVEEDSDEDDEDDDSDLDSEGADLENFVICTLDTERVSQLCTVLF